MIKSAWGFSVFSGFLSQSKNRHYMLISDLNCPKNVSEIVCVPCGVLAHPGLVLNPWR